ncbi:MAG: hypothetical protein ACLUW6_00060 [Coriobacteriaceae bacterium]
MKSLAHFIADITPQEARDQVKDFISTHEAAAAWIRSRMAPPGVPQARPTCDPALEDELFGPPWPARRLGDVLGHAGERRILFYAPSSTRPPPPAPDDHHTCGSR